MASFINYLQSATTNPLEEKKKEEEQALAAAGPTAPVQQPASLPASTPQQPAQPAVTQAPKPTAQPAQPAQPKYAMGIGALPPPGSTARPTKTGSNTGITQKQPTFFDFVKANQGYGNTLAKNIIGGTNTNTGSFGQSEALSSILKMGVDPSVYNVEGSTDYSAAQKAIDDANYAKARGGPAADTSAAQQQVLAALEVQAKKDRAEALKKRLNSTDQGTPSDMVTADHSIAQKANTEAAAKIAEESAAAGTKRGEDENRANVLQGELQKLDEELALRVAQGRATPEERARIEQDKQARLNELGGLGFEYAPNQEAIDKVSKGGAVNYGFIDRVKTVNEKGTPMYTELNEPERAVFDDVQNKVKAIDDKLNQVFPEKYTWDNLSAKGGKEASRSAVASIQKAIDEINESTDANEGSFEANQRQKLIRLEAMAGLIRKGRAEGKKTGIYHVPNQGNPTIASRKSGNPLSIVEAEIAKLRKNLKYGADRAKDGDDFSYGL